MDNSVRGFEDALLDIYIDQFCTPSKSWLDLADEDLTMGQLGNYKKKKLRASLLYQKKLMMLKFNENISQRNL